MSTLDSTARRVEAADPSTRAGTAGGRPAIAVSVAIPAYTMKRWEQLRRAVESARAQTVPVDRVVVCIDNNDELLRRAEQEWRGVAGTPVTVIANLHSDHLARVAAHRAAHGTTRRFGAGSARNTAARFVDSDVIAFIDDDAHARSDWLERLLDVFADPSVVAVGGPRFPNMRRRDRPGSRTTSTGSSAAPIRACRLASRPSVT